MKRMICLAICLIISLACVGCGSDSDGVTLASGSYYAVGDYEELMTPYLWLDTEERTFMMGAGMVISYAEHGTYRVEDGKMIATSQSTTFVFEINDSGSLVLIDNGDNDFFKLPLETEFIYSEGIR